MEGTNSKKGRGEKEAHAPKGWASNFQINGLNFLLIPFIPSTATLSNVRPATLCVAESPAPCRLRDTDNYTTVSACRRGTFHVCVMHFACATGDDGIPDARRPVSPTRSRNPSAPLFAFVLPLLLIFTLVFVRPRNP